MRAWDGHAAAYHYDYAVRVYSEDVGDDEIAEFVPILQSINWLRHLDLRATIVTEAGKQAIQESLPDCYIWLEQDAE